MFFLKFPFPPVILVICLIIFSSCADKKPEEKNGMIWIPGGENFIGSDHAKSYQNERPAHGVTIHPFWMDKTEVSNAQFKAFVEATGYVTLAEQKPNWEELKKQVAPGTPAPPDSLLVAGSLIFNPKPGSSGPHDWWQWQEGAYWEKPEGSGSHINDRMDHPVVHIAWEDAQAYCDWAGKRLPTEAEWEFAARGGLEKKVFPWGSQEPSSSKPLANVWQGTFPDYNSGEDGFLGTAPVGSFPANGYGLYDMAGNVWEWTQDWYQEDIRKQLANMSHCSNPKGPSEAPQVHGYPLPIKVIKGGSYLCHPSYCESYRPSARQYNSVDSGSGHLGFRCVKDVD